MVLAGGKGRRMGGDKPWLKVEGKPMIAWAVETLERSGCEEVWAVFRRRDHRWEGPWLVDEVGEGPAAGLRTALREFEGWRLVVTACDVLFDPLEWSARGEEPKHAEGTLFPVEVVSEGDVGGSSVREVLSNLRSRPVSVRSVDADETGDLKAYRAFLRRLTSSGRLS